MKPPSIKINIVQFDKKKNGEVVESAVVNEVPVALSVNGKLWFEFMCSPIDLEALAVGYLFNEELFKSKNDLIDVSLNHNRSMVDVWIKGNIEKPKNWRITSGCLGGRTRMRSGIGKVDSPGLMKFSVENLLELNAELLKNQDLYQSSRGIHACALSDGNELIVVCEDIGRHNAVDKVSGRIILDDINVDPKILFTSGRISSEMLQKAVRMGAPILVSRTSPTALAIELAVLANLTIVGYARGNQMKVYSWPERIQGRNG